MLTNPKLLFMGTSQEGGGVAHMTQGNPLELVKEEKGDEWIVQ